MAIVELKPCPFCGGEPKLTREHRRVGHGDYVEEYFVTCKDCKAKGASFNDYTREPIVDLLEWAVTAWNRRVGEE